MMMTYEETLHYLYTSTPVFQHAGLPAYKPGLETSIALDDYLGNPHRFYRTIHVAGTNGKGSVSHLLAAILQQCGYKVGLYTSPHLLDFRERIRVNGQKIPKDYVVRFVEQQRAFFEPIHPSFFELTSSMAFDYFRSEGVDWAVVETGMGGRLDSTNIITPRLSVITNISLDHTQFLGDTVEMIAAEKAGIIKSGVPVVVGEAEPAGALTVFRRKAESLRSPLYVAQTGGFLLASHLSEAGMWQLESAEFGLLSDELGGVVQTKNAATVLAALHVLKEQGVRVSPDAVRAGFENVVELTGLMGRWQVLRQTPKTVCDTGHNVGGWQYLKLQLEREHVRHPHLFMVVGMVGDKDVDSVLALMPREASYFFTQASVERAMPAGTFARQATAHGLSGEVCPTVAEAVRRAQEQAGKQDLIFIGGSNFVVADALLLFIENGEEVV